MFQVGFKEDWRLFRGSFKCVSSLFEKGFMGVSIMFMEFMRVVQESFKQGGDAQTIKQNTQIFWTQHIHAHEKSPCKCSSTPQKSDSRNCY